MKVVAPIGWSCAASYGADSTGGISVYPSTEPPPSSWSIDWNTTSSSPIQAITINRASPCTSCMMAQACPLFPSAAAALKSYSRDSCPGAPASEIVEPLSAGLVLFQDPPGTPGASGVNATNGVMTYYPQLDESYVETCTLPSSEKIDCTSILNVFIDWYGKG